MSNEIVKRDNGSISPYTSKQNYVDFWDIAVNLSQVKMIPSDYQGAPHNVMVALEMANRMGVSPLMVMQNLNVIEGRPSWSSTFIIAAIEGCGRFGTLRFKIQDLGQKTTTITVWSGPKGQRTSQQQSVSFYDKACVAYATDLQTGEVVEGPPVSIEMAIAEGWYNKTGSKWKTMPELMLRYRAAAFFGRLYASGILMGLKSVDEVEDIDIQEASVVPRASEAVEKISNAVTSKAKGGTKTNKPETEDQTIHTQPPSIPTVNAPEATVVTTVNAGPHDDDDDF